MCSLNQEYQYINPSTQVSLASVCVNECSSLRSIQWYIYQGVNDSSTNTVTWKRYANQTSSQSNYFYGTNTSTFTANNSLFVDNEAISYWSFEVVYVFLKENSSSALNFVINQRPTNGSCSIEPPSGTSTTLFKVDCPDWTDQDKIKDFSLYSKTDFHRVHREIVLETLGWNPRISARTMITFSVASTFLVRLPVGDGNASLIQLIVEIRDLLNCVAEFHMQPLAVTANQGVMDNFIELLKNPSNGTTSNPIHDLLASGHPNTVAQVTMLIKQELHTQSEENLKSALNSEYCISRLIPVKNSIVRRNAGSESINLIFEQRKYNGGELNNQS